MEKRPLKDRVLSIWTDWDMCPPYGGCGYYRCIGPMQNIGIKCIGKLFGGEYPERADPVKVYTDIFSKYDVLYAMKVDNPVALSQMFAAAHYFGKRVITDYDDDYFTVDPWSPVKKNITPEKLQVIDTALKESNAVCVSTPHLQREYQRHTKKPIYICENSLNPNDFTHPLIKKNDGKIRIGWQGSITHERDLAVVMPIIKKLLKHHKDVVFCHLGYDSDLFNGIRPEQHENITGTRGFPEFPKHLANQGWDIGIAPLANMRFNYSKSAIKYYEYSIYKIASVVTNYSWSPYYGKFKHNVNGLGATDRDSWYKLLHELIHSEGKRKHFGEMAYKNIMENYTVKQTAPIWERMLEKEAAKCTDRICLTASRQSPANLIPAIA